MPELPEVETVRRGLEKLILGKKISSVEIRYPKMIKTDLDEFRKEVPGQEIQSMGRRGKYLLFYLTDKVFLETWVKVKKNWRDKKLDLADFGYNEKEY